MMGQQDCFHFRMALLSAWRLGAQWHPTSVGDKGQSGCIWLFWSLTFSVSHVLVYLHVQVLQLEVITTA